MQERKVALITGAATGIGRAITLRLAQEDINVVINYSRSEQEARQTQKDVETYGVKSLLHRADVADDEAVRLMIKETLDTFGRLDILVNNAGTTNFVDHDNLEGLKDEYWDRVMNINVKGMFSCCRAAAPELKKT